jgi:energy-coupling factor transport system permease protein
MKSYSNFFAENHPVIVFFISYLLCNFYQYSHPVFTAFGALILFIYVLFLIGIKKTLLSLLFMLPILLFIAIINPFFNHAGSTPLFYFNGKPITLEALLYGFFAGILIFGMILLFRAMDRCISSHKFIFCLEKYFLQSQ